MKFNEKKLQGSVAVLCDSARAHVEEVADLLAKYYNDNDVSPTDGLYVAALVAVAMWKYQGQPVEPLLATILVNWDSMTVNRHGPAAGEA